MQEKNNLLKTPVRYFKGVGPKKSECLGRLGIETAEDIIYYLPKRYEDRSKFTTIRDLKVGERQTIRGEIVTISSRIARSGMPVVQMAVTDHTGLIHAMWFNQLYLKNQFEKDRKIILYGRVELFDKLQFVQPEYELVDPGEADSIHMGRIVPIYALTTSITQKYLRGLIFAAIEKYDKHLVEKLPTYVRARQRLVDIKFAADNIHFPSSFESLERAYRRIVFEEFFMLQLALAVRRKGIKSEGGGFALNIRGELIDSFRRTLPFELTDGQKKAVSDIERDMSSGKAMNRLLEGDVGSGKTVVASHAMVLAAENGFQSVLMAPTEILARQHFITLSELLMPLGINITLLVSGIDPKARQRIYSEIRDGSINIIVGTHAVIQESVSFKNLGLAVIDEQHKFGVTQRAMLKQKGYSPHILVMTATPIPRTLAMTVYGDLDISVIKELPKGRKPIATYWVEEEKREEVYNFIREELDKGRQAYVVYPLIEKGAEDMYKVLKDGAFRNYKVGLLHGRMPSGQKERVMKDFKNGKINVLVSTIVIEVGVDIPNATVMLVENAERFGLAQLHQLRGRVGRGSHESYCVLLANPKTDEARARLKAIEGTLDGFQIAEADLDIRGPGESFGTRQHGLPEIRFGNILKDFAIMEAARKEAFELIVKDPGLREEHHKLLKESLVSRFKERVAVVA